MTAPFFRQFFPDLSHPAKAQRFIDNHYHLEMVADNSHQIVEYQAQMLQLQQQAAITNIRAMGEIAHRQDHTNSLLSALTGSMDTLNATATQTLHAVYAQTEVLQEGFEEIAARLLEQQRVLQQISDILRRPYKAKALELLNEADRALKTGAKASGRDQEEWYKDAARLLQDVLDNPIGRSNYVAWFQTGWLKWKFQRNLAEAEEAFYQAARLSASNADLYHAKSLHHLAEMQYLEGRPAEAYDTINRAFRVTPEDHDTMYDAARYAAKTGREREALELLDKCIELQPHTTIVMFSEEDFVL